MGATALGCSAARAHPRDEERRFDVLPRVGRERRVGALRCLKRLQRVRGDGARLRARELGHARRHVDEAERLVVAQRVVVPASPERAVGGQAGAKEQRRAERVEQIGAQRVRPARRDAQHGVPRLRAERRLRHRHARVGAAAH
eukprot:6173725-Pleurochrysis_carterae.AAC.6